MKYLVRRLAAVLVFCTCAAMFGGTAFALQSCGAQRDSSASSTYTYRQTGGTAYLAEVRYPSSGDCSKDPAIVFFHGGSWKMGSRRQFVRQAKIITRQTNVVVISVDYPLNRNPIEATEFASAAMCWVKTNAEKLGIDPDHIAISGGSAGGQIALAVALMKSHSQTPECKDVRMPFAAAAILFNPVLDLSGRWSRTMKMDLHSVSPLELLNPSLPPTLILQGTSDKTTPVETARSFVERARELGIRNIQLSEYPGRGHGFFGKAETGDLDKTTQDAIHFLAALGWIKSN